MVCNRCILVVRQELEKLNINACNITLGELEINGELTKEQVEQLGHNLEMLGFEILDDSKYQLIEKIKNILIKQVHHQGEDNHQKTSVLLSKTLHKDYSYLSSLFSAVEGVTIEKYIINIKIEKAKELIIYDELSLSEIAHQLGYSSVAHLSSQFKKVTDLTPSHFREVGQKKRKPIDKI